MNVYFSGIGGVGIGPLAEIALDTGYIVHGSDVSDSPLTEHLRTRGVAIDSRQDGFFLRSVHADQPIDWLVYTSALTDSHPELLAARELGIKTAKRDELLARIIAEKELMLIAIAGTHGKTTTTGMLVWAFKQFGIPVSYSIGTTISFGPSGAYVPGSKYFVYECDEFDRNFLHFSPDVSLITSIGYDHPDTYPTESEYLGAFKQFADQSQQIIMWQADNAIDVETSKTWLMQESEVLDIPLAGVHNRRNATLVVKTLEYLRLAAINESIAILNNFPGTHRRFERLGDNLYSDYGHHPIEIAASLQMASELSDHIVLVYQPHQNIRQHEIKDQYTDCFMSAENIYWLPTYLSREDPTLPILTPSELTANMANQRSVHIADLNDDLWQHIDQARQEGKLVLCMGAGTIDAWLRDRASTAS